MTISMVPKYVVTMDELDMSRDGIKHRNIRDFLLAQRKVELKCSSFTRRYAEILPIPRMKKRMMDIRRPEKKEAIA